MPTPISGYFLEADKWEKDGLTWWKGLNKIVYDGCNWMYYKFSDTQKKIFNIEDLNDKNNHGN